MVLKFALDPFKKGKKTEVEGVRKVDEENKVENDLLVEKAIEQYEKAIEQYEPKGENPMKRIEKGLSSLENIILIPSRIDMFLQEVNSRNLFRGLIDSTSNVTGLYITKLIQDSYNGGKNNFILRINEDYFLDSLGFKLTGKEDNPIKITIVGNIGDDCGYGSENSHFTIQGDTLFRCGSQSKNSHFTIHGNAEIACGYNSTNSHFTINGNTGYYCGSYSKNSYFTFHGDVNNNYGVRSKNSTFRTFNQKTYEKMLERVRKLSTIQLIDRNENVLKERKNEYAKKYPLIEKAIKQYKSIESKLDFSGTCDYISSLENIILSPEKIDMFLQEVISRDLIKRSKFYNSDMTGLYVSKLIQNSYGDGNNNFVLHTKDCLLDNFGYKLKGKEDDKIHITITNNIGDDCGYGSENSHFTIQGDTGGDCGAYSENSSFIVLKNARNNLGLESKCSDFTIKGNVGSCGAWRAEGSKFTTEGTIPLFYGSNAEYSTFRTSNKKAYEKMLEYIDGSNTVQLLDEKVNVMERNTND